MSPFLHLPHFSLKGMKKIMSFGGFVSLNGILWFFFTRADNFIIGKGLGSELLGYFSVGSYFSRVPMEKISPIVNQVIFPAFARIQDDRKMARAYFLKAVRITSLVAFPSLWGVSSIASELVDILLGKRWQPSTVTIQLLSLVVPVFLIRNMISPIMMGMGRADIAFKNSLFGAILLPLSILIAMYWGLVGVSLAWVIALPLVLWENLFRIRPVLEITILEVFGAMRKSFLAAVCMYAAIMAVKGFLLLDPKSIGTLVLLIITGVTVYVGTITILHEEGCREVLAVVKKLRISK
jgi:teichuronic acid exporter